MNDLTDLVDFLRARLDKDEQVAKECGGAPWSAESLLQAVHVDARAIADNKLAWGKLGHVATVLHEHDRQHIARHDLARVLRDVEAKRRIIEGVLAQQTPGSTIGDDFMFPLYALAAAYSSHPAYNSSWAL